MLAATGQPSIVVNLTTPSAAKDDGISSAVASSISALAWPLAIIALAILFRNQISEILGRVKSFEGFGAKISTDQLIERELPKRNPDTTDEKLAVELSPLEAVVISWTKVEKAVRDAAMRALPVILAGGRTMPYSTVLRNMEAMERENLISDPSLRPIISDLAKIRNQIVHRPEEKLSRDAILTFLANATWAIEKLDQISPPHA